MRKIVGFFLLGASSLHAGTPGNDDVSILYGIAMALFALMLGVDYLIKFIKKRKLDAMHQNEEQDLNEMEDLSHPL